MKTYLLKIIKTWEQIDRKDLIYEADKYAFNFDQSETIRSFGDTIFKIILDKAVESKSTYWKCF